MTSAKRPDPLMRLDSTSQAIADLRGIFAAEEPLDQVLARVASTAAKAIPDADAVSISVLNGPSSRVAACTDDRIAKLERMQYDSGQGPCVESIENRRPVRLEISSAADKWREFAEAAKRIGIYACLSVPLLVQEDSQELVGALNVYSYTATAFDPFDEGLMRLYTAAAEQAIVNARRWQQSRDTITQLERALTSRAEIDQAKGILMAVHGCSADEAFQRLVQQSQRSNTKVHDVACQLLASAVSLAR